MMNNTLVKLILFLVSSAHVRATQQEQQQQKIETYNVPTFTSCEIQSGEQDEELEEILTTTGLFAIRVPTSSSSLSSSNNNAQNHLLQNLCQCNPNTMSNISNGDSRTLADGLTTRSTIATATRGFTPLALPEHDIDQYCGKGVYDSLEQMRDYVSVTAVKETFIPALDRIILQHHHQQEQNDLRNVDEQRMGLEHGYGGAVPTAIDRKRKMQLLSTKDDNDNGGYSTITSILKDANHLEHFHLYSKKNNVDDNHTELQDDQAKAIDGALDWHTDGGLFLAFVPGQHCHESYNDEDDSFRIAFKDNSDGKVKEMKAIFPDFTTNNPNEIVIAIMLGAGAEHWLNTPESLKLKATKHAVKMKGGDLRAWYGMMHLVPTQAIIQHLPTPRTFGEMKQSSVHSVSRTFGGNKSEESEQDVVIGCGNDSPNNEDNVEFSNSRPFRRLQHVGGQKDCDGSGNYFCWLSCLSTPDDDNQSHLDNGESLYCLDPSVLDITGDLEQAVKRCSDPVSGKAGGVMDEACQNTWHPSVDGVRSYLKADENNSSSEVEPKYCYGATAMYMQGFEWEGTTCVAYLFSSWVLSTRGLLILGCIGTILLSILTEVVISRRRAFLKRSFQSMRTKLMVSALLYAVQVTMGYAVMLVIMTYSGPLVISVIVGLALGHVITNWEAKSSDEIELGGSTPCCQYEGDNQEEDGKPSETSTDINLSV